MVVQSNGFVNGFLFPFLLLLPTTSILAPVISAPASPDPFQHSDLNLWFLPRPPRGFFSGEMVAAVLDNRTRSSLDLLAVSDLQTNTTVVYGHDGSPVSAVKSMSRAIVDRFKVVALDLPCPRAKRTGDDPLVAAVERVRMAGVVVLCAGDPRPEYATLVRGGVPGNFSKELANTDRGAGTAYRSTVEVSAADLNVTVVPRTVSFEDAGEGKKSAVIMVSALGGGRGDLNILSPLIFYISFRILLYI